MRNRKCNRAFKSDSSLTNFPPQNPPSQPAAHLTSLERKETQRQAESTRNVEKVEEVINETKGGSVKRLSGEVA